jgi:hypothetical protein
MIRNCLVCDKEFKTTACENRRYCSNRCVGAAKRTGKEMTCPVCGKRFYLRGAFVQRGTTYCSRECLSAATLPNRTRICEVCGREFVVTYANYEARTCSKACKIKLVTTGWYENCQVCGAPIWVTDCHSGVRKYCSLECQHIGHGREMEGEKHFNWLGGLSRYPYPPNWNNGLKRRIKARDNFTCQNCGTDSDLTVHHIDHDKDNLSEANLITLCRSCNSKANVNVEYWKGRYSTMLAERYA